MWSSIASALTSWICVLLMTAEKWNWYFKPLTAGGMALVISLAITAVLSVILWTCRNVRAGP